MFIAPLVAFALQKCVIDTLSPISIKLNFSQADSETANITLNMDSKKQSAVEVRSTYNINIHNIDKAASTQQISSVKSTLESFYTSPLFWVLNEHFDSVIFYQ